MYNYDYEKELGKLKEINGDGNSVISGPKQYVREERREEPRVDILSVDLDDWDAIWIMPTTNIKSRPVTDLVKLTEKAEKLQLQLIDIINDIREELCYVRWAD